MMQAKILFFFPALGAGGLERVLSVLSSSFAEHYSHVEYIMWHDKPQFYDIDERVKIVSTAKECDSTSLWKRLFWLRKYVAESKPDLVMSFSTPFNMIALTALAGSGVKVVVAERNDPAHFRWGHILKMIRNLLYSTADGILVQTETERRHLCYPLSKKAVVIPNPLFMDNSLVGSALNTDNKHLIVSVSRLVPQKRNDLLINAFRKFVVFHPDYQLVIFGDGPEKTRLNDQISRLGLGTSVHLLGNISQLWERMKSAEMFVMASEYEGMSNALLEAMALGLPCISTKVSGAIDIIEDRKNGLLVEINDEDALLAAMQNLADDVKIRTELGENASRIAGSFDVKKISRLWIDYIDMRVKDE